MYRLGYFSRSRKFFFFMIDLFILIDYVYSLPVVNHFLLVDLSLVFVALDHEILGHSYYY
jgi:type III secretory pathway component EscT